MEGIATLADQEVWAESQFGPAELGDARRTRRAVWYAARAAVNSSGPIPQQSGSAGGMKAVYRLFGAADVTHEALTRPHMEQTRAMAGREPMVFLIQDTAELNFSGHLRCEGLGPIGGGKHLRGLHQQNVLAVSPATEKPLGLMYQAHHRRQRRRAGHSRDRKAQRAVPLRKRESFWWLQAIETIGPPPPGVRWVHVGDRGEDIFGVYDRARTCGTDWLIRAARDRTVGTPAGQAHLFEHARSLPRMNGRTLTVRDRKTGATRTAELDIAAGPVKLLPVKFEPAYRGRDPVPCWVLRVWEPRPPPKTRPVEWILLTSLECATPQQALFAARGYSMRWMIEEFHKCEKTGCQVEARRLEHTDRLEPLIGMLSVLAVWLLTLKLVARDHPERQASASLDHDSVRVMARYLKRGAKLTMAEFWRGIGLLGGHPGRAGDGPIGWLRAWRGWQAFQLVLLGAHLSTDPSG